MVESEGNMPKGKRFFYINNDDWGNCSCCCKGKCSAEGKKMKKVIIKELDKDKKNDKK